jgi:cell division protein FtsW
LKKRKVLKTPEGFIQFLIVIGLFFLIFLKIPDLGTLLVLGPVSLIMYRYAGWKFKFVLIFLIIWIILGLTIWMQFDYIKKRIDFFLNPDIDVSWRGIWWQTKQALIAVGAGGLLGEWYGKGLQKFGYIPEAYSDFIFAAFSEEIWFVGNMVLLILYALLIYFSLKAIRNLQDDYYKLLGIGIISLIFIQVFVNIWVNIKLLPITGITLPFISYWGTSLIVSIIELVLLYKLYLLSQKQWKTSY